MRVMADRAVFTDGLVVLHERPAFFHMAGVAGFIHAIAFHELWTDRAVRVMAIGTPHFSFGNRMMRRTADLRALLLVAGKAHAGLSALVANVVVSCVDYMAGGAGYVFSLVSAPLPVRTVCILAVAGKTSRILHGCVAWRE